MHSNKNKARNEEMVALYYGSSMTYEEIGKRFPHIVNGKKVAMSKAGVRWIIQKYGYKNGKNQT